LTNPIDVFDEADVFDKKSSHAGFVVPIPTLDVALTNKAVAPEAVCALKTFPVPNCWTDRAFPEAVLPNTKQLLVFRTTGTVGAP
jgi:hypothetical protein